MLKIEFAVTPTEALSGFGNGDVIFSGENGAIKLNSMVFPAATHLMYEMEKWYEQGKSILEFNAVDSREFVKFNKESQKVTLWARGRVIGTEDVRVLLDALLRAASKLYTDHVSTLDRRDGVRDDFEMSFNDFRDFMAGLVE